MSKNYDKLKGLQLVVCIQIYTLWVCQFVCYIYRPCRTGLRRTIVWFCVSDLAALIAVRCRALELVVATFYTSEALWRPSVHVDEYAAGHAFERPPHPVLHLVRVVHLDWQVPDVRHQFSFPVFLLDCLGDFGAVTHQLFRDGRDRYVVRQVENPQPT